METDVYLVRIVVTREAQVDALTNKEIEGLAEKAVNDANDGATFVANARSERVDA